MTKRMLVDATHPEETRVAIVDERRLEDFDFESSSKRQLKGNIYLAKVVRIEPSLQAAFVEYGGNRHGFLSFSEIHPDYFRIPIADRPHDEEEPEAEDDTDISAEDYAEEVRAYQSEVLEEENGNDLEQNGAGDAPVVAVPSDTPQAVVETPPPSSDIAGLGEEASVDLGLITDFGNAVVDPVFAPAPAPLEAVGGSEIEEEEVEARVRRTRLPRYKIQEVVKRRQIMLIQVVKEERGNKGAALTTFLSLAGRYCVLMPNTDRGGGVSRKITSHQDRRRMKEFLDKLETPEGMAVILRTAGMEQEPAEIQRDLEHLLRLWNNIREQTLISTAPTLIYEEANLIKRSIRDLYAADVAEILVAGKKGYDLAHDFMRSIMPEAENKVKLYEDPVPLFFRYNVERQIDGLYNPIVQLRSGGYIVINPTEALVSIDVNSGRATRERHIEGTALKTNLEAADEIARQLRLRDLAGLIVIDFIDMEDGRNNAAVERRMKEAMKIDRARLQIGRLSAFGLMEISRQRLHPSLTELNFERCPHCGGVGLMRTVDSAAISILRQIEEDALRQPNGEMVLHVPTKVALYILNQKRSVLHDIERRYNLQVLLHSDDTLVPPDCRLERSKGGNGEKQSRAPAVDSDQIRADAPVYVPDAGVEADDSADYQPAARPEGERNGRRRGRFGRGRDRGDRPRGERAPYAAAAAEQQPSPFEANGNVATENALPDDNIGNGGEFIGARGSEEAPRFDENNPRHNNRRRGRRGGRSRHGGERRGDSFREGGHEEARPDFAATERQSAYAPPAVHVPVSIHDLDTTPRDPRAAAPAYTQPAKPAASAPPPSPYEVTNPESDRPKGGWWRKLTGQE
ncbi:MAG: ribonuclease E/G [Alphaproteobacteria bacterium]|nr:ribonuclease E/G [Alphaproteobacteria bacterium]